MTLTDRSWPWHSSRKARSQREAVPGSLRRLQVLVLLMALVLAACSGAGGPVTSDAEAAVDDGGELAVNSESAPLTQGQLRSLAEALACLLYTSPSPRDLSTSRMPSSA